MSAKRVLVIDNDQVQADNIMEILKGFGAIPIPVVRPNSTSLLPIVTGFLDDQTQPPFDATILDVIFTGETFGGLALWKKLDEGHRGRAGKLLIVTKGGQTETRDFANIWAEGRICFLGPWDHVRGFIRRHIFEG